MSTTILVVGGVGYVGCHTVLELLLQNNFNVVVVDILDNCNSEKPEALINVEKLSGKYITFYNCTIQDEDALSDLFSIIKIDCVIHLASIKNVTQEPLELYTNDFGGSISLFRTMKKYEVKKIIFSSTVYVYGSPDFLPITENHDSGCKLRNVFSKSKNMIEEVLKDLCKSDNEWTAIVLRHTNPAGAHESGLIGERFIKNQVTTIARHVVLEQEKIYISREEYENINQEGLTDYLHVSDVANAFVLAVNNVLFSENLEGFRVYNLGTDCPHSVLDVIERISVLSGQAIVYEVVEKGKAEPALYVSSKLAEEELGWKAEKSLDDICRDTLRWVRANSTSLIPMLNESETLFK